MQENNTNKEDLKEDSKREINLQVKDAQQNDRLENSGDTQENAVYKRNRIIKILFLVLLIIVAIILVIYVSVSLYYSERFLCNTSVNGVNCGGLTKDSVVSVLNDDLTHYELVVLGRNPQTEEPCYQLGVVRATDIDLNYVNLSESINDVILQQNKWMWVKQAFGYQNSYTLGLGITYDETKLNDLLTKWNACQATNMRKPQDAYISEMDESKYCYSIVPDTAGSELIYENFFNCIIDALLAGQNSIDIDVIGNCYKEASVTRDNTKLMDLVNQLNSWLQTNVVYDWNDNEVILDATTLAEWITLEKDSPVLDEDAVTAYVRTQASKYDTYGKSKNFVTTLDVELTLRSPNYGWKTDVEAESEELIQLIYSGSNTEREPIYSFSAQNKGMNDIGDSYVEADLTHQHLYLYDKGEIIFETDFVSGSLALTPDCVTPAGIYGLTYKTLDAVLRGANYATPVKYWMPFYGNYGMHDATWRSNFGGTIYREHGSHGCINLPLSSAAFIYEYVYKGYPVICYYYDVDPLGDISVDNGLTDEELIKEHEPTTDQVVTDINQSEQYVPSYVPEENSGVTVDTTPAPENSIVPDSTTSDSAVPDSAVPDSAEPDSAGQNNMDDIPADSTGSDVNVSEESV